MRSFFIAFILYGLVEISLYLLIGKAIGIIPTLLLIVATGAIGIYVVRTGGMRTVRNIQSALAKGEMPAVAMIEGLMVFIGGLLLVLPGVVTDVLGLLLLFKPTRNLFKPAIFYWLRKKTRANKMIIIQK